MTEGRSTLSRSPAGFPADFLWGAATSAYQIEGSPLADGAGESNWHRFSHSPGACFEGHNGDVACDHYLRYREDVALMAELGLNAYRFSIAWSRVQPQGRGRANPAGLDFYRRLVDALLEHGIQPCATLYHWDHPAALDDAGGWLNSECALRFADYAQIVFRALGDRVSMWGTINEPWVVVDAGYLHGVHSPGHRSVSELPRVAHNLMRAHGAAVQACRGESAGRIGLVVNLEPKSPATSDPRDIAASERADAYMNRYYLDAIFKGEYPADAAGLFGNDWPSFSPRDMELIRQPIDFLGVNYYTRGVTADDPTARLTRSRTLRQEGALYTETGWEVHAPSLSDVLLWLRDRYGEIPLYITENGAAFADPPHPGNTPVEDPLRVDYLRSHLQAARYAIDQGVDLRGYFAWSLLDNFEWACGYSKRFGLVRVDSDTQRRTLKSSAHFYRDVIASNGKTLA